VELIALQRSVRPPWARSAPGWLPAKGATRRRVARSTRSRWAPRRQVECWGSSTGPGQPTHASIWQPRASQGGAPAACGAGAGPARGAAPSPPDPLPEDAPPAVNSHHHAPSVAFPDPPSTAPDGEARRGAAWLVNL